MCYSQGYKQKFAYIAAQCPLVNTVSDFWRMISEFSCGCIIMLCPLEEEGQVRFKIYYCECYNTCIVDQFLWLCINMDIIFSLFAILLLSPLLLCRRIVIVSGHLKKVDLWYMGNCLLHLSQLKLIVTLSSGRCRF